MFSARKRGKKIPPAEKFPLITAARAAPVPHLTALPVPPPSPQEYRLYDSLRAAVPVIGAAISKIVRLAGGFRLTADDPAAQEALDRFSAGVCINGAEGSLQLFADQMLDSLLTYGNAAAELLPDENGRLAGITTAHPAGLIILPDGTFCVPGANDKPVPLPHPERILSAALDPPAGSHYGVSILRGLPCMADILMRIFYCTGRNYERAGNLRYAVTYRPSPGSEGMAREHAQEVASAWQEGIRAAEMGEVQDFITAGDVSIQPIGAEVPLSSTEVPVRQIMEQIVARLSIPPFLLGLSWSSTERMSAQQADILTSELEYFRRVLTPMLVRAGTAFLRGEGFGCTPAVAWDNINLQDETELAEARLKNAQAAEIEQRVKNNA